MPIFLVRHGSTGLRNDDDPDDAARHLDETGDLQAAALVELLGPESITRVVSSPADRCIKTVSPLAAALGLEVEIEDHLFEGTSIERSWEVVERLAASGVNAVLCSHGDVIPEVVSRAKGRGMEIRGKSGCSKGSIWKLRWDGERFDLAEYQKNRP